MQPTPTNNIAIKGEGKEVITGEIGPREVLVVAVLPLCFTEKVMHICRLLGIIK